MSIMNELFLTEEHLMIHKLAREFAEKELTTEILDEVEETAVFPQEILDKMAKAGFFGIKIPKEYGGSGSDCRGYVSVMEEICRVSAVASLYVSSPNSLAGGPFLLSGTEEQKKQYLPDIVSGKKTVCFALTEPGAGSDASAGKTTAVKDGDEYVLNGRKCFITNGGVASFYCVTAMTDKSKGVKGISMFLIDAGTPGLSTGHEENKMGIRTSNTCDVVLEDCRIPAANLIGEEGKGFGIAMKTLDQARAWMGCVATGIAQRGINEAVAYGKERIQFGKPIIKNQALQFKVADMEIKTETARQMVAHALTKMDMGLPYTKESAIAKCYASDIAMEVASEAIQMFGGYGYSREYPVEKLLRDAKIFQIFEGTNEVQRIVVANNVIGK